MKILLKLLTIFAVLCTVACSQTFEDVSNNNLSSNSDTKAKGLLAMNVGEMSRTITNTLTNADIHSAVLTANNETVGNWSGEDVIGQIESDKSIILDVDYYDFVLSVKNEAGKTLATAQTNKYIEVGTNHISLLLKSVTTGEGSFEVTFSWQSDYVNSIKAGLYDCETDEEITGCEMAALTVTDKTAVYAKDDLPVGQYILMLNFYDNNDGLLKTYTEVLRVEAYRKTTATRQFAGFNTEHTIEYELTESWKSDFTPVTERNAAEEVELPTIENIDTEKDVTSYILKWYTTETFDAGTEIKKIEAGTDKDMKLYGQIETCYRTTADGFLKTIQSLTVGGPHNVIVTGELTDSQLSTMATYIKNYSTRKINLDLSETTGLTEIYGDTFSGCTGLVNIIIPDSVTSIYGGAFYNCSSLTGITIPDSVTRINNYTFVGCSSLTAFNVSANNNYYCSSDDGKILYNKDKTTLLAYSSATGDVTIPDSVTSIGSYAFSGCNSLASVTIGDSVTSIGSSAFSGCSSLASVTIPDSVTSIGEGAFYNCSSLVSVTIPDSVTYIDGSAFEYCSSLESVYITDLTAWMNIKFGTYDSNPLYNGADLYLNGSLVTDLVIPAGMTSIGKYAFSGCGSLASVTIPDSVTSIGEGAFSGCDNLEITINTDDKYLYSEDGTTILLCDSSVTSVIIPENVASINYGAFACCRNVETIETGDTLMSLSGLPITAALKSITIGNGVTSIGSYAFENCSSLTSVTIGDSVTSIGSSAFSGCSSLESVTIGNSVMSIGNYAFSGCSSLASVTIPDSVTSIGSSAFSGCSSLASVTIPDSVTSIGSSAFSGCSSLASVTIPDSVTSIGSSAFSGCSSLASVTIPDSVTSIGESAFRDCSNLASVTIPDSVTSIGRIAFYNCSSLTSVVIPDSVTSIDGSAFEYCSSLASVVIPDSVTSIGSSAFYGCYALTSVVIPDSVTSIGSSAFYNCSSLESVTIGNSVTSIGEDAFQNCGALTSVYITDLTAWKNIEFENASSNPLYNRADLYLNGSLMIDLVIPAGMTSIGKYVFYNCSSLTSVVIPDSVTSIGEDAFRGCISLASVVIPDSVTSIGEDAFQNCGALTSVYITDLTAWKNIEFENATSNPLYYGVKLYLNGSLAEFTVTFDAAGGSLSGEALQTVVSGEKVIEPTAPSKTGYVFYGWYTSADGGQTLDGTAYNFDTVVKKDITLYAKWIDATIGCIAYSDGTISADYDSTKTPVGIVIEATDGTATKIVSLTQTSAKWSTEEVVTNATSETDGMANMTAIQSISGWEEKYPAFKWCDEYTDRAYNSDWYLPAKDELDQLYTVKDYVNAAVEKITAGEGTATKLGTGYYWSSSQDNYRHAWLQRFSDGLQSPDSFNSKYSTLSVRAVRAF